MRRGVELRRRKMKIEFSEKYLNDYAKDIAEKISNFDLTNQIRKFYDEFKILERRLDESDEEDKENWFKRDLLPLIKFVKSKVVYSAGRENNKAPLIPKEFKDYLFEQIDDIDSPSKFRYFIMHYQALIGYYKYISTIEKDRDKNKQNIHNNFNQNRR